MRIGIDARLLGSAPGIGRYIENLLKRFFVISPEHTYVIFLRDKAFDEFTYPKGVNVEPVHVTERWYSWSEQITWPYRLAKAKLDLLFVPQFNVPLITPCPFVVTIHDVTQLYVPGRLQRRSPLHRFAFRIAFWHAVRFARTVIAVSEYTRQEIVKNFGIGEDRIRVIYEGRGLLVPAAAKEIPNKSRTQNPNGQEVKGLEFRDSGLGFPRGQYLLTVGVWRPHKNLVGLLEAFAHAINENPEIASTKLVLVGEEDPRYPEVRATITRLKLEDSVVTPGSVSDDTLDAYYRGARAVILPSFFEGFGFAGVEALARNIPVAASNVAAIPEILGAAALYFDPSSKEEMSDAIMRILTDSETREQILLKAPKVLGRYSWDRAAEETIRIIETVKNR